MPQSSHDVTVCDVERLEAAFASIESWTDQELVGQLFSVAIGRHSTVGIAADAQESHNSAASSVIALIESHHLGGVCYFPTNLAGDPPQEIAELTASAQRAAAIPLLISTDQENGTVSRLKQGFTRLPSAMALAATTTPELWEAAGRISAQELVCVGINHAFAPVADMNTEPRNPVIGVRSPGAKIRSVSAQLERVIGGMSGYGVATTLKHFPGHGTTTVDSHLGLPHLTLSREDWAAQEREAFRLGIAAGADSIMIGHLVFDAIDPHNPATFSQKVVTGELRESLGFQGVIVTDALEMSGALHTGGTGAGCVAALAAGVDQLLMPGQPEDAINYTVEALRRGELQRASLENSARRILTLKLKLARTSASMTAPSQGDLASPEHVQLAQEMADRSVLWRERSTAWSVRDLPPGARIFVVGPATDPIGRGVDVAGSLVDAFAQGGFDSHLGEFGASDLIERAAHSHAIVVVTRDAWRDPVHTSDLTNLLAVARESGVSLCVIASRNPSDSGLVPNHVPLLLMFGDLAPATNAVIRVLNDELTPTGTLPVDLLNTDGKVGWTASTDSARD